MVKLGLKLNVTHLAEKVSAPMIRYAYGDDRWTKPEVFYRRASARTLEPDAPAATILGEILGQICGLAGPEQIQD